MAAFRAEAVGAIIAKDLRLFVRDRFYLFVSVLALVAFGGLFWVLPSETETMIRLGVHLPGGEALLYEELDEPEGGFEVALYPSEEALERAITDEQGVVAGLSFPPDFLQAASLGRPTTVRVLLTGEAPDSLRPGLAAVAREVTYAIAGSDPPVTLPDTDELVLGVDRGADPLPLRDQLRPLLIFVVLTMEMIALASLVATEIAQRTVTAILVTPARIADLLAAKGLLGGMLAFGQGLLIAGVTGTLGVSPGLIVTALLLGALLVTGLGLLAGATGQDFIGIVFWGVLLFVPLIIPAFAVLFPGTPDLWVRLLPSYGLVETLVRVTGYGEGWSQVWPYLVALATWCVLAFVAGAGVLARRVARA